MASFDLVTLAVLGLAVGGVAAVIWEILAKAPRSFAEMATDSRRFAEAPLASEATPSARRWSADAPQVAANANHSRLAA